MGEIVSISFRDSVQGGATCTRCQHKWQAVAPTGTTELECPECKSFFGLFDAPVTPVQGEIYWRCDCDGELFYIMSGTVRCRNCGTVQTGY